MSSGSSELNGSSETGWSSRSRGRSAEVGLTAGGGEYPASESNSSSTRRLVLGGVERSGGGEEAKTWGEWFSASDEAGT